jgi:hypothetical protein
LSPSSKHAAASSPTSIKPGSFNGGSTKLRGDSTFAE